MIEVNLLPGGRKRASRGPKLSLKLPSLSAGALPKDPWLLGSAAAVVAVVAGAAYLYWSVSSRQSELEVLVAAAVADSARYADLIEQANRMTARRDSIAQRVAIIQEIDGDRYVWPHILDEVARALPDYTWLDELVQVSGGANLRFRILGKAGNNLAVTRFMENLEASFFIRGVELISTEQMVEEGRMVNQFHLEAFYERPPVELLETVPLFGEEGAPAADTVGRANPSGSGPGRGVASWP